MEVHRRADVMNGQALRDRALAIALTQLHVRETAPNSGPKVDLYLQSVGLPPGQAWCAAFVVWCYVEAAKELSPGAPLPIKRTGKVTRLWSTSALRFGTKEPVVGAIYCHATSPDDPDSPGHCGIVESVAQRWIRGVEGNSNAQGSRNGIEVCMNRRGFSYVNLGYLDVGAEITAKIRPPIA